MKEESARIPPKLSDLKRLIRELPKLSLNSSEHEINEIPREIKINFIHCKYMTLFEPFAELNARTLKLVNYEKAAINISFFEKHKYKVQREPEPDEIEHHLNKRLDELKSGIGQTELFAGFYSQKSRDEQREELVLIQKILSQFHDYEYAVSNYFRNYTYWYVTWRWENEDGTRGHGNDHLLKDETDYDNNTTIQKQNVMFVDMDRIGEHTPYQSKKVEKFLKSFESRIDIGTKDIFWRLKGGDVILKN